jgi:CheY-like chemotaxis protein/two-component sensor histidine kinase
MCLDAAGEEDANGQRLAEIIKAGRRASDLIRQILTFSRQDETELRPLDLGPAVKEIAKMLKASLPASVELDLRAEGAAHTVMANLTQMHQVIMNLVGNASQAMPESGGVITVTLAAAGGGPEDVEARDRLGDGPLVKLEVADDAGGIDPAILDNIFDPFFTTKKPGSGTGMGLALVHGIVSSHGGAVTVESEPGRGSTFRVYLPAAERAAGPVKERPRAMPRVRGRALFVDDEAGLADVGGRMLEAMGFTADAETDPLRALEMFEKDPGAYDLVVTDQTMPGLAGADLARAVLEKRPDMPVIMCTGFSETMTRERAAELGVRGYLLKPVLRKDLARAVAEVFPDNAPAASSSGSGRAAE